MGCCLLQPDDDDVSIAALKREDAGGKWEFDVTTKGPCLRPCGFAARMCKGIEKMSHSHLGEGVALRCGIHEFTHVLCARPFTAIWDCIGLEWIFFSKGHNPVILRSQVELMGWWFTICHRPNPVITDADCWSCLEMELHVDPLLCKHMQMAHQQQMEHPHAATGTSVKDKNMPHFRRSFQTLASHSTAFIAVLPHQIPETIKLMHKPPQFPHNETITSHPDQSTNFSTLR